MFSEIPELTTQEVCKLQENSSTKFIDIRPVDAYNGWALRGESRPGHIRGAKSLPLKWTNYMDWIEIVRSKHILTTDNLIIYGYNKTDAINVGRLFRKAGYKNLSIYNRFVEEWTTDENTEMDCLPRFKQLVPPQWVNDLLNGKRPETYENKKFVICHAHYRNRYAYEEGHIPGAIEINTNTLESPETWNRRSPEELKKLFECKGITADTTVILYGRFAYPDNADAFPGSSAGHLGAIRAALIMMYAGIKDIRVLNGGFRSWIDEGFEISQEETKVVPVRDFGADIPAHPELIVDVPEAKEMIQSEDAEIVSVRSWSEYIGEVSGYNYIEKKGRIPGSVFGNCGSDAYHMENYRNLDHTTREYHEIEDIWKEVGITADKHLAFYCGTGWRGSEAFYNAWLMGWPRVSVFDGGWFEWSNDPRNAFEIGVPEEEAILNNQWEVSNGNKIGKFSKRNPRD